jgi:hypothetical protein
MLSTVTEIHRRRIIQGQMSLAMPLAHPLSMTRILTITPMFHHPAHHPPRCNMLTRHRPLNLLDSENVQIR